MSESGQPESDRPEESRRPLLLLWIASWALVGALVAGAITFGPLDGIAHVQDEIIYTWQAERITEGRLGTETPSPRAAWHYHFLIDREGRRFGIFPIGWPVVLAIGVLFGQPAIVNPILHGLVVLLGALLARREAGAGAGALAAPLLALSPQALLQGASRMSHVLVALLTLAALWVALDRRRWTAGVAATLGGAIAGLVLTRPLDAVVVAGVVLPVAFWRRWRLREAAACIAPMLAAVAVTCFVNVAITGSALRFPQSFYFDEMPAPAVSPNWSYGPRCNALGFGPDRGCFGTYGSRGFTPGKAVLNTRQNLRLSTLLWMGSGYSLALLTLGLLFRDTRRLAAVALALWAGVVIAYALYWYHGSCLGARFYHLALPPVVLACAAATAELARRVRLSAVVGLVLIVPMALAIPRVLPELRDYWGVDNRFHVLQRQWQEGEALVLVGYRYDLAPMVRRLTAGLASAAVPNLWRGAWFGTEGPIHFAEYQPALVAAAQSRFPGVPTYLYVMSADRRRDELRPLVPADRAAEQLSDLPLPADIPAFPTSQTESEREELVRELILPE